MNLYRALYKYEASFTRKEKKTLSCFVVAKTAEEAREMVMQGEQELNIKISDLVIEIEIEN